MGTKSNANPISQKHLIKRLQKYDYQVRRYAMKHLLEMDRYKKSIEMGLPFYTREELDDIEKRYPDGMTWKEIERELFQKGVILKRATFRKWVEAGLVPRPNGYKITSRGREAKYPASIIEHINFCRYLKYDKDSVVFFLMDVLDTRVNVLDAIIESLPDISDDIYLSVCEYICFADPFFPSALEKVLGNHPDILQRAEQMLENIRAEFEEKISPKIEKLRAFLKSCEIRLADTLACDGENEKSGVSLTT